MNTKYYRSPLIISSIPTQARMIPAVEDHGMLSFAEGQAFYFFLGSDKVGFRQYDGHGHMLVEFGLRDGVYHGWYIEFDPDCSGCLHFAYHYANGLRHGNSFQFGKDGRILVRNVFDQGTGRLIVCQEDYRSGKIHLSQESQYVSGQLQGVERYWNPNQKTVWEECYWYQNKRQGIMRRWKSTGDLQEGYPRFFYQNKEVSMNRYLDMARANFLLPKYRTTENEPGRSLPKEEAILV